MMGIVKTVHLVFQEILPENFHPFDPAERNRNVGDAAEIPCCTRQIAGDPDVLDPELRRRLYLAFKIKSGLFRKNRIVHHGTGEIFQPVLLENIIRYMKSHIFREIF